LAFKYSIQKITGIGLKKINKEKSVVKGKKKRVDDSVISKQIK
jgi:hypothetical protein